MLVLRHSLLFDTVEATFHCSMYDSQLLKNYVIAIYLFCFTPRNRKDKHYGEYMSADGSVSLGYLSGSGWYECLGHKVHREPTGVRWT